ncbi:MAG: CheR family methyltransferase [Methylococcales bacterium]
MKNFIVGIGASAGGLEALFALLPHLKPNANVSYLIAQHMAHNGHSDLMQKLLSRHAHLEVVLAESGQKLLPDHIYLIPAGSDGVVIDGFINLQAPKSDHVSTPSVNVLFESIGQVYTTQAVGIVLSGTGSDGVIGCRTIKRNGGMTMAQDPGDTIFNGMPNSAIEAGVIDQILRPQGLAEAIMQKLPNLVSLQPLKVSQDDLSEDEALFLPILKLILKKTQINFVGYRTETLRRRLDTRMQAIQVDGLSAYYDYLLSNEDEIYHIQQLFLVSFSSFFRDAASFEALEQHLIEVAKNKQSGDSINVWVAGCASGEEAYSLAIMLSEIKLKIGIALSFKVIDTDLNPIAIAQAREGTYTIKSFKEMPSSLMAKYTVQHGEQFMINDSIKSLCHFELANVFDFNQQGTIDLVSCRNLLIYLSGPLQNQLIARFYDALVPEGMLFLGQSESLSPSSNGKFRQVSLTHRLFMRRLALAPRVNY